MCCRRRNCRESECVAAPYRSPMPPPRAPAASQHRSARCSDPLWAQRSLACATLFGGKISRAVGGITPDASRTTDGTIDPILQRTTRSLRALPPPGQMHVYTARRPGGWRRDARPPFALVAVAALVAAVAAADGRGAMAAPTGTALAPLAPRLTVNTTNYHVRQAEYQVRG